MTPYSRTTGICINSGLLIWSVRGRELVGLCCAGCVINAASAFSKCEPQFVARASRPLWRERLAPAPQEPHEPLNGRQAPARDSADLARAGCPRHSGRDARATSGGNRGCIDSYPLSGVLKLERTSAASGFVRLAIREKVQLLGEEDVGRLAGTLALCE